MYKTEALRLTQRINIVSHDRFENDYITMPFLKNDGTYGVLIQNLLEEIKEWYNYDRIADNQIIAWLDEWSKEDLI